MPTSLDTTGHPSSLALTHGGLSGWKIANGASDPKAAKASTSALSESLMTDYQMPAVSLGDWVYFYAHENADPTIALVSKVGRRALELWAISPGYGGTDKPSVHHKDDPGFN